MRESLMLIRLVYSDVWNTLGGEVRTYRLLALLYEVCQELIKIQLEESDCISDDSDAENAIYLSPKHESGSLDHGNDVLFSLPSNEALTHLHPDPVRIFKLWQVFLENVNPLTKILHAPIVQQQMLKTIGDLNSIGKGMEALLFSIYSCALHSMTEQDVKKEFDQEKSLLQARFRTATQKALSNAGLLKTTDLVLLQAFCLYIVRRYYWVLNLGIMLMFTRFLAALRMIEGQYGV